MNNIIDFGDNTGSLDLILSFWESPQQRMTVPLTKEIIKNRKLFFMYVASHLTTEERQSLVKISCCVYYAERLPMLKDEKLWYNKCNGKFYDNAIRPLMKSLYNIECTYEPIN